MAVITTTLAHRDAVKGGRQPFHLPYKHRASQRHKFILVAIPFFILAGELMGGSGILSRLLDFAKLVV
ncbi:MAG: TRAP transporter large permease subunit, partial [Jhaorihella sp.]